MFTVNLDCELSGNSNTRRPLSSWYSVMPSTDVIFLGPSAARQICAAASETMLRRSLILVIHEIGQESWLVSSLFFVFLANVSTLVVEQ